MYIQAIGIRQGVLERKLRCLAQAATVTTGAGHVASMGRETPIHQQAVAGDERRLARREPNGSVGNLFRLADATDGGGKGCRCLG
jgi:hypothetical protein